MILLTLWLAVFPGGLHALTATTFFPANNATNVCADTPLKITFDTAPTIGTSGAIRIYSSAGILVDTLDLAVAHTRTIGGTLYNAYPVLVTGTTASIFPRSGVLAYNTTYYVTIDATVFPGYAGLSGRPHGASPRKPPRHHLREPISPSLRTAPGTSAPCRVPSI